MLPVPVSTPWQRLRTGRGRPKPSERCPRHRTSGPIAAQSHSPGHRDPPPRSALWAMTLRGQTTVACLLSLLPLLPAHRKRWDGPRRDQGSAAGGTATTRDQDRSRTASSSAYRSNDRFRRLRGRGFDGPQAHTGPRPPHKRHPKLKHQNKPLGSLTLSGEHPSPAGWARQRPST